MVRGPTVVRGQINARGQPVLHGQSILRGQRRQPEMRGHVADEARAVRRSWLLFVALLARETVGIFYNVYLTKQ